MVIGGIDEAGYGPVLGPLVVGCCAVRVRAEAGCWEELGVGGKGLPSVWGMLRGCVGKKRDAKGRRLHVADSKAVYSPSGGIKELERGVVCFASLLAEIGCFDDVVRLVDPGAAAWLARHPWYMARDGEPFPISGGILGPTVNGLRSACGLTGVELVRMGARVTPEGRYNDLVGQSHNKASALFSLAASLLDELLERYAEEPGGLVVVCDRQGGRERYVEPLRTMFPEWDLTVVLETPSCAEYELRRGGGKARVIFREKGEELALPTAMASMLCKYMREGLMGRFNRWWAEHVPGVAPTAGYHPDGIRFLGEIAEARMRLGIRDGELVRSR